MTDTLKEKVEQVIKSSVKPMLQSHGGDVELVDVSSDGVVQVRLLGMCLGCPSAQATINDVVFRALKENVPEIKQVLMA